MLRWNLSQTLFLLMLCFSYSVNAAKWINAWSDEYQTYYRSMSADANNVLQTLLSNPVDESSDLFAKIQYQYALSQAYYQLSYPGKALQHARIAMSFADQQQQPWIYHQLSLNQAMALDITGQPQQGIAETNAALAWANMQADRLLKVSALFVRGSLRNSLLDYSGALRDLQQAYSLADNSLDTIKKAQIAGMLALVFEYREEDSQSIPYFEEAVAYHRSEKNWQELSISLYGLGRANKNVGNVSIGRNQLEQSLLYARQVNDLQGIGYALKELARLDIVSEKYADAEAKLLQARDIFNQSEHTQLQLGVVLSLAEVYRLHGDADQALRYLNMAKQYIDPEFMPIQQISLQEEQAHILALQGDFKGAYTQLSETIGAKKNVFRQQSREQLQKLRTRYEVEVKERQNQLLEQENKIQKTELKVQENRNAQLMLLSVFSALLCLLLFALVYRTKRHRKHLEELANTDSLTQLYNRRRTLEMLSLQIDLANRHQHDLSVAMIDLDHFKLVNDQFGHAAGDQVLKAFASLCLKTFRHTDIVGRVGGEEFLIALPHTEIDAARQVIDNLRLATRALPEQFNFPQLNVSISCGLCLVDQSVDIEEIIAAADRALYEAKQQGRNRVYVTQFHKNIPKTDKTP